MPNVQAPLFRGGKPALGVFVCNKCGDGIVGPQAERVPAHTCTPNKLKVEADAEAVMFRILIDMPTGRSQ